MLLHIDMYDTNMIVFGMYHVHVFFGTCSKINQFVLCSMYVLRNTCTYKHAGWLMGAGVTGTTCPPSESGRGPAVFFRPAEKSGNTVVRTTMAVLHENRELVTDNPPAGQSLPGMRDYTSTSGFLLTYDVVGQTYDIVIS